MGLKILITGTSGFIGRNLREKLSSRYSLSCPTSSELDLRNSSAVQDYLDQNRFDTIIHSATWDATRTSTKEPSMVLENNLRMFFNLAGNRNLYGRMIYFGSGAEYDRYRLHPETSETSFDSIVPEDPYGFSKYIMRKSLVPAGNIYDLVLFGVYGKYEDWRIRFISQTCCRILHDLPVTINQDVRFDYLYVDDLASIVTWFIEKEPSERVYNICSGKPVALATIAELVLNVSGSKSHFIIQNPGMGPEYSGSNRKLLNEMGAFPFTDLKRGIQELFSWYQAHKNMINIKDLI